MIGGTGMEGDLRPGGMALGALALRDARLRVVAVVAVCSLLVLLAWPGVALADCPAGEEMCMDVEPLKGPPGSLVHVQLYGTGRTFTVTPLPDTATSDPGGGPPVIAAGIGLLAVVAGIAALRRRLPVRSP